MKVLHSVLLAAGVAVPAGAIDPGTVKATFAVKGEPIELRHAYAHLHDNAEGLLDRSKELRILLTDREVPRETLYGLAFLPVTELAMQGKVRGMLFRMDPAKPNTVTGTLLMPPSEPGESLTNITYFAEPKLFKRWSFSPQRVVGELEQLKKYEPDAPRPDAVSFAVAFSAPVFNEPAVTADLKGKAAQASRQVRALTSFAGLLAAGNVASARKLQTERAQRRFDAALAASPEVAKQAKAAGAEMKRSAAKIQRVVVRGSYATAIAGEGEYYRFAQEGGGWKIDP